MLFQIGGGAAANNQLATHDSNPHMHVQVQQQIVLTPDGTPMQVVRIVKMGHQQAEVNLKDVASTKDSQKHIPSPFDAIPEAIKDLVPPELQILMNPETFGFNAGGNGKKIPGEQDNVIGDTLPFNDMNDGVEIMQLDESEGNNTADEEPDEENEEEKEEDDEDEEEEEVPLKDVPNTKRQDNVDNNVINEENKNENTETEKTIPIIHDTSSKSSSDSSKVEPESVEPVIDKEVLKDVYNKIKEEREQEGLVYGPQNHVVLKEETQTIRVVPNVEDTTTVKSPPQSIFRHLFPSRHRYTILRDEL